MPNIRTDAKRQAARVEAERLARAGVKRTEIARELGVPWSTISYWALQGGWRARDLRDERSEELGKLVQEEIAAHRAEAEEEAALKAAQTEGRVQAVLAASGDKPDALPLARLSLAQVQVFMEQGDFAAAERVARAAWRAMETMDRLHELAERARVADEERARRSRSFAAEQEANEKLREGLRERLEEMIVRLESGTDQESDHAFRVLNRVFNVNEGDAGDPAGPAEWADAGDERDDQASSGCGDENSY